MFGTHIYIYVARYPVITYNLQSENPRLFHFKCRFFFYALFKRKGKQPNSKLQMQQRHKEEVITT